MNNYDVIMAANFYGKVLGWDEAIAVAAQNPISAEDVKKIMEKDSVGREMKKEELVVYTKYKDEVFWD